MLKIVMEKKIEGTIVLDYVDTIKEANERIQFFKNYYNCNDIYYQIAD